MSKTYDKIIRDKIPQILIEEGKGFTIDRVDEEQAHRYLVAKLHEELGEFSPNGVKDKGAVEVKELVDIMECCYAIARIHGIWPHGLDQKVKDKREERGGFEERIILKETH